MPQTLISVAWSNGRWRVTETGPRNAISCFDEWQDAMDYATGLAARTQSSSLVVCGRREPARGATARS